MEEVLSTLQQDTSDFWIDREVGVIDTPSTIEFLRDVYSQYKPVIIRGCLAEWPAMSKWNKEFLIEKCQNVPVNINLTSDGFGDCVKSVIASDIITSSSEDTVLPKAGNSELSEDYFVYPAECDMTMKQFYTLLENNQSPTSERRINAVPYLSQQNDNLRTSFPFLLDDIKPLHFAEESFGVSEPEAVNLWIGDERSVSSIHKDHYENMYAVISGEKVFTLLPPTDVAFLPESEYKTLRYKLHNKKDKSNGTIRTADIDSMNNSSNSSDGAVGALLSGEAELMLTRKDCPSVSLNWIPLDPEDSDVCDQYPDFRQAHPVTVRVRAGEVLYIPAMWYHRVTQSTLTVAVNYWYDQRFDFRFVFYQTVKMAGEQQRRRRVNEGEVAMEPVPNQ